MRKVAFLSRAIALVTAASAINAIAQTTPPAPAPQSQEDLTDLDLNDLMNVQVTTASRKAESLFGVAAAIHVITQEDIKRSGAINIPEILRQVPGLQVAQINNQQYAVTSRGFNSRFANRLLVLIDGRSIYNNLYGGVYWEDYNIALDEIERIEVIKGPGGALWGANAVNGVINIITKHSKDTQGTLLFQENADEKNFNTSALRYGGKLLDGTFRFSILGFNRGETLSSRGNRVDSNSGNRFSLRFDQGTEETGKLFLSADVHQFDQAAQSEFPTVQQFVSPNRGGNILARYNKLDKSGASNQFQFFWDRENRDVFPNTRIRTSTIDFDFQRSLPQLGNHNVTFGFGYRNVEDDANNSVQYLDRVSRTYATVSAYMQDNITLSPKTRLVFGLKLEDNDFTGFEYQPSLRYSAEPSDRDTFWAAASRAVRVPNRAARDGRINTGPVSTPGGPADMVVFGDAEFPTSAVYTVETGVRRRLSNRATVDVSAFHSQHTNLDGLVMGSAISGPSGLILPLRFESVGEGTTYGVEVSSRIQVRDNWRLDLGYSFLDGDLPVAARGLNSAKHQYQALSTYTLNKKISFDQAVYFAGAVAETDTPSYIRYDLQLRYIASPKAEFAIGGRNLGMPRYNQIGEIDATPASFIQPELFVRATLKF